MFKLKAGWTKAKVFKKITAGNNGIPCLDMDGACAYSDGDGNHCAIGCFIPKGHPGMEFEGPVDLLLKHHPDLKKYMPFRIQALAAFQAEHDAMTTEFDGNVHSVLLKFLKTKVKD